MSTTLSTRMRGGGIAKRAGGGRVRVDRDGDLDMDAPQNSRGRYRNVRGRRGRPVNINNKRAAPDNRSAQGGSGSGIMRSAPKGPSGRENNGTRSGVNGTVSALSSAPLLGVRVKGWKESKASAEDCTRFLERKSLLKFKKTQKLGDSLVIYVPASDLQKILEWDKAKFAGSNLKISADVVNDLFNTAMEDATPQNCNVVETIKILEEVLRLRYNAEAKFLDLSKLGDDPLLRQNGFFELNSTTSKMFPALMSVADQKFNNAQQKREWLLSVSLAGNNLKTITPVTTLSVTFPDLKNLSLEGNAIEDMKAIEGWRNRFKNLEQLVLVGNPIVNVPGYKEEMIRRYPKLVMLDNNVVDRLQIQIGDKDKSIGAKPIQNSKITAVTQSNPILPQSTKGNLSVDANGLAMAFLSTFFSQIDSNKEIVLKQFYTEDSKFSLSVNTSAPTVNSPKGKQQYWDVYIPKSHNMKQIHDGSQIKDQLAKGSDEIRNMWNSFPATRHNLANQELWSFDIVPLDTSPGVGSVLATVHSEFEEMNPLINSGNGGVIKRSFDRSFTLVMDVIGGVKVVSDLMVVRSYSGTSAWREVNEHVPTIPNTQPQPQNLVDEKQQKCQMLSEKTGLNLKFAEMCLLDTNWDLAKAWDAFIWAKDKLGPEAYAR